MERPGWLEKAMELGWIKRPSLQERLDRRITNLNKWCLATHIAKPNDKKGEPIAVYDHKHFVELWFKVIQLVDEVNDIKQYITSPLITKAMTDADVKELKEAIGIKDDDENKSEDVASIIQWHKDTFPRADFEGQVKKWEEEYSEFLTARTNNDAAEMLSELADLFIVACGIMRFNLIQGCQRMLLWNELRYTHGWAFSTCEGKINTKMKKNRARKWEYLGNGNYHHVKGMED